MNSVEIVKALCKERKIPISKLEKDLGFANGYIGQLKKGSFPGERLNCIADYLNVNIDSLLDKKSERLDDYNNIFTKLMGRLSFEEMTTLLNALEKIIDYLTRIPSAYVERAETLNNLNSLLNHYSEMILNSIELSIGSNNINEDFLLLLRNYDKAMESITEHKETVIRLSLALRGEDTKLKDFLEKYK